MPMSDATRTKDQKPSPVKDAIAGALTGAVMRTVTAPVERVKLLIQLQGSLQRQQQSVSAAEVRQSAFQVASNVYRTEGLLAFWRGNTPSVINMAGASALNFMLMDHYKRMVSPIVSHSISTNKEITCSSRKRRRKLVASFLSGGLAGA
jgi:solute carrier family 25 (adenine nucleotide translocator) protein 4/5/6/31